ncbi:MAG TPA: hypothetical protein ENK47_03965 [Euryarchaeota archaeon]|nr:hypothetical protein [Euryarchaeota archaeon]
MGKLEQIGERLGLTDQDIADIRKERMKWGLIIGISSVIAAILMFILGFLLGSVISGGDSSGDGYPYAASAFAITGMKSRSVLLYPLVLILGFFTGMSGSVYGNGVRYGVFSRRDTQ